MRMHYNEQQGLQSEIRMFGKNENMRIANLMACFNFFLDEKNSSDGCLWSIISRTPLQT